jgi:hypothetical protein
MSGDVRDPPVVNFYLLFMHLEHAPLSGDQLLEQRAQPLLGGLAARREPDVVRQCHAPPRCRIPAKVRACD